MPLRALQNYGMPGNPTRQTFPVVSFGWLIVDPMLGIPAGITQYIKEGPVLAQPAADEWMCGVDRSFDLMAMTFDCSHPISFIIEASLDGVIWRTLDTVLIPSMGDEAVSVIFSNYVIPAWTAKFAIHNPGPDLFEGQVFISARAL